MYFALPSQAVLLLSTFKSTSIPPVHSAESSSTIQSQELSSPRSGEFMLKTKIRYPNPMHRFASNKEDLYVQAYQVKAGEHATVLNRDGSLALKLSADDGQVVAAGEEVRLYLQPRPMDSPDQMWQAIDFSSVQSESRGLKFDDSDRLQWKSGSEDVDWMACDWSLGQPQLFWRYSSSMRVLPVSCDIVDLVIVED